jgi:hypothetical protein
VLAVRAMPGRSGRRGTWWVVWACVAFLTDGVYG